MRRAIYLFGTILTACRPEPAREPSVPPPTTSTPAATVATAPPPAATATTPAATPSDAPVTERGIASWYGDRLKGHKTASGERFDPTQMTAAHRTLPLGTWVEVSRPGTSLSVRVRINDRGPMSPRFVIDLSRGAAERLGMVRMGVAEVELRIVPGP